MVGLMWEVFGMVPAPDNRDLHNIAHPPPPMTLANRACHGGGGF